MTEVGTETEVLSPADAASDKKVKRVLTDEQKAKMQAARKENEARRFANTKAAIETAAMIEQVDVQKTILTALEGKATVEQLQVMVDEKNISAEFMALCIECGVTKRVSQKADSLPYKWGSFRAATEGTETTEGNATLRELVIAFDKAVEDFRKENAEILDAIAAETQVVTGVTETGSEILEGAEWMDYFRFPDDLETQAEKARIKAEKEAAKLAGNNA